MLVDKRYFFQASPVEQFYAPSALKFFVLFRPLFPAVHEYVKSFLSDEMTPPETIIRTIEEFFDKTRTSSERGQIMQRVFLMLCYFHSYTGINLWKANFKSGLDTQLSERNGMSGTGVCLQFKNRTPCVEEFQGCFPDITRHGIYWSTDDNYPLVEGFLFNGHCLVGIQCTLTSPHRHSSNKIPSGPKKLKLLENILEFCEKKEIIFALVYVVPKEVFLDVCGFNLLDIQSFLKL